MPSQSRNQLLPDFVQQFGHIGDSPTKDVSSTTPECNLASVIRLMRIGSPPAGADVDSSGLGEAVDRDRDHPSKSHHDHAPRRPGGRQLGATCWPVTRALGPGGRSTSAMAAEQ